MTGRGPMVERLKKRRDFRAVAKGRRTARRAFILEALQRGDSGPPRFGFTVSKRVAKSAVERNRIRRRLREAARMVAREALGRGSDYVLVGRRPALTEPFRELTAALHEALSEMRHPARETGRERGREIRR